MCGSSQEVDGVASDSTGVSTSVTSKRRKKTLLLRGPGMAAKRREERGEAASAGGLTGPTCYVARGERGRLG
jgi:hypothetical protein